MSVSNTYFKDYEEKTCLIYEDDNLVYTSKYKGVKPLLDYYRTKGVSEKSLTIVDRIVGRGAVILAKLIGASKIYTPIASEPAQALADRYQLKLVFDKSVPHIINRDNTGPCPIESCVMGITDVEEGYQKIVDTIAILMKKSE